jgi:hypothetical protein
MKKLLILALLAPVLGCGGDRGELDLGGDEMGPDRFAVESREGEIKMALTDRYVYFALSEAAVTEARSDMEEELKGKEGLGGLIGGVVSSAVGRALESRIRYPIEQVRDIRWEDGTMVFELEGGRRRLDEKTLRVDDRPVTEAFDQAAVEAFATEFRRAKAERGSGG